MYKGYSTFSHSPAETLLTWRNRVSDSHCCHSSDVTFTDLCKSSSESLLHREIHTHRSNIEQ